MSRPIPILLLALCIGMSSCNGENLINGLLWGMKKFTGEGFIPSTEILALGEFQWSEVQISKNQIDGISENQIELRFFNGKSESLRYNEENVARTCAELYAGGFSKIREYETIKIVFVQIDPINSENIAMSEYLFQVADLID